MKDHARQVMKRFDLYQVITSLYAREDGIYDSGQQGKIYRSVAEQNGLHADTAKAHMVVVGNAIGDRPLDLEGVVFIELDKMSQGSQGSVLEDIIDLLYEKGKGDFNKDGFDDFLARLEIEMISVCQYSLDTNIF